MRYLIALDRERSEGVLSTETGIVLRYIKEDGRDVLSLLRELTDKIPFSKKQAAIHVSYGDRADSTDCDRLEKEIETITDEKTLVLCEDRMAGRLYAAFGKAEDGIILYVNPDAGAGRIWQGGLAVLGGLGAPVYSDGAMYVLAQETIRAAFSAYERRGPHTILPGFLEEAFGLPMAEIKSELGNLHPEKLSSYARLCAKGKKLGDGVSAKIWDKTVLALSRYVFALSGSDGHFQVKLSETPDALEPLLIKDLSAVLGDRFSVSASSVPILLGGIKRGAEMLGIAADETFCRTLSETYKNFTI